MEDFIIKVENLSKEYKLGQIGGGTLNGDLQSWWAKVRGKEDPNASVDKHGNSHLSKSFLALNNINFEIKPGERVGIIGHNGAGKSTLLKLLSRVTSPTTGTISYKGKIASMLEVGTGFHPELTGRENVYLNGAILGMKVEEIDRKFNQIVEFAEMEQFIDTPVKRYSSGMYVKLAFAVAAHLDSDILIMDEVLAVGDMKFQQKCLGTMGDISSSEGRTILYVSHNMNTVRQLCNRCIVLNHGQIIYDGDVDKAIDLYLGNIVSSNIYVNLSEMVRENSFKNSPIKFQSMKLIEKDNSSFNVGDKLKMNLKFISEKNIDEFYIRLNLKSNDEVPITMATLSTPLTVKRGENEVDLLVDISHFVPGKYTFDLISFMLNEYKTGTNLDVLRKVFYFDVLPTYGFNNNMEWDNKRFGYMFTEYISIL